jgi:hypothetical protein
MAKNKINQKKMKFISKGFQEKSKDTEKKRLETEKRKELEAILEAQRQKELEEKKRLDEEREEQERISELNKKIEMQKKENFKIKITTLSPIHIGSGEVYEPTNFVIKDEFLYYFDEFLVFDKLIEKSIKIPSNDKLMDIHTLSEFFKSQRDFIINNNLFFYKVNVSKDIVHDYENNLNISKSDNENDINQMLILQHIKTINPNTNKFEAYIPGSSIKGALQTVLNLSVEESRDLKISDSIGKNVTSQIAWGLRVKKDVISKKTIPQKIEVISNNSQLEFIFTKIKSLSFEEIIIKLNNFYELADKTQYINYSKKIKNSENSFILKVGRYCGQNFINIDKQPKTKTIFSKTEKNTINNLDFGWLLCEVVE